jgi:hypothetical protein
LFPQDEAGKFRTRWDQIQTDFVDDPRGSVQKADRLVADTVKRLAEVFADQRTRLEHEWDKGDSVSTEDLRQALRRYEASSTDCFLLVRIRVRSADSAA